MDMMIALSEKEILCRLVCATLIGMFFGMERAHQNKPIGMRTHMIISLTACTLAIISSYGFMENIFTYSSTIVNRSDPARLMVGMLTGIGFLGAGIIYKEPHGNVHGITTAAEVYLITVLGIGIGLGLFTLSLSAAAIAYLILLCKNDKIFIIIFVKLKKIMQLMQKYFMKLLKSQ